jgi:hypothetical protein
MKLQRDYQCSVGRTSTRSQVRTRSHIAIPRCILCATPTGESVKRANQEKGRSLQLCCHGFRKSQSLASRDNREQIGNFQKLSAQQE